MSAASHPKQVKIDLFLGFYRKVRRTQGKAKFIEHVNYAIEKLRERSVGPDTDFYGVPHHELIDGLEQLKKEQP